MNRLREAIADLAVSHPTGKRAERSSVTAEYATRMKLPESGARSDKSDYDKIAARCLADLVAGRTLSRQQLRQAAWAIWATRTPIYATRPALAQLLAQIEASGTRASARSLALSYLSNYRTSDESVPVVADSLRRLVDVAREPFPRLARDWQIFDATEGPRRLASLALGARKPPSDLMLAEQFSASVARGGFAKAATFEALKALSDQPAHDPDQRLRFVRELALDEKGKLYFDESRPLVANALLLPFKTSQPHEDACDRILDLLIGLFGDPRTESAAWDPMREAAEIARRWLTRQALRQFLDVVDAVAPVDMWHYRRRFWEEVYRLGLISAAWVVLDGHGQDEARRRFGRQVRFGEFISGGGIQRGHSVLMLRIGREVCVEWSHNGKCRFWADASRPGAPTLYRGSYAADELRWSRGYAPVLEVTHYPHVGVSAWQHKVAARIHGATQVRLDPSRYL